MDDLSVYCIIQISKDVYTRLLYSLARLTSKLINIGSLLTLISCCIVSLLYFFNVIFFDSVEQSGYSASSSKIISKCTDRSDVCPGTGLPALTPRPQFLGKSTPTSQKSSKSSTTDHYYPSTYLLSYDLFIFLL